MKIESLPPLEDARALNEQVRAARMAVMDAGRPDAIARQHAAGKQSARERIATLCDAGSFREMGALVQAARETEVDAALQAPADGVLVGTAHVAGRPVALTANDASVLGGSSGKVGMAKLARISQLAVDAGMPLVRILEGGGHRIQEGQDARHFAASYGIFQTLSHASGWIPMAAGVFGAGFAGPANHAALSDFVVMIRGKSTIGMAGPALVKAGVGESVDKEALGGADVQADVHGIVDLAVDSEEACIEAIRRFLSYFPQNARAPLPIVPCDDPSDRSCDELMDIVPANRRRAYDVLRVVECIADAGSIFELKPTFASNMVTALARLHGRPVGIIANNPRHLGGMINAAACDKAARFIALCDAFGLPLVYLIDVPGFAIGTAAEQTGLARRSARLLAELGQATVPRVSVTLRKGYGLGYYAMCGGRLFEPDGCVIWPTAEICAMSVEGAVDIAFRKDIEAAADTAAYRQTLIDGFRTRLGPLRAAEHFGVDDVIDPAQTRKYLIDTLAIAPARRPNRAPPKFRAVPPI